MLILVWLIVAIVAAIGEVLTMGLFLAAFAVGAVLTAVAAAVVGPIGLDTTTAVSAEIGLFAVLSLLGVGVFRPVALRALGWRQAEQISGPVSQSHLANKRAEVTQRVDGSGGQIRIGQGEFWSARAFDPNDVMEPGSPVDVVLVDGITALVTPVIRPINEIEDQAAAEKGT